MSYIGVVKMLTDILKDKETTSIGGQKVNCYIFIVVFYQTTDIKTLQRNKLNSKKLDGMKINVEKT